MIRMGKGNFDWSPDSRHFAYSSKQSDNWGTDIRVIKLPLTPNRLTNHVSYNAHPAWSPDGRRIAFSSSRDQELGLFAEHRIFIVNRDGSGLRRVTQSRGGTTDLAPRWSPDGLRIAYHSYVASIATKYGNSDRDSEIWVINTDGSGRRQLTNNNAEDSNPDWGPDGRRIAFQSNRDGNYEIYLINSDGSGLKRLTNHPGDDTFPRWSPDGEWIAFISDRSGGRKVRIMAADGSFEPEFSSKRVTVGCCIDWNPDRR